MWYLWGCGKGKSAGVACESRGEQLPIVTTCASHHFSSADAMKLREVWEWYPRGPASSAPNVQAPPWIPSVQPKQRTDLRLGNTPRGPLGASCLCEPSCTSSGTHEIFLPPTLGQRLAWAYKRCPRGSKPDHSVPNLSTSRGAQHQDSRSEHCGYGPGH